MFYRMRRKRNVKARPAHRHGILVVSPAKLNDVRRPSRRTVRGTHLQPDSAVADSRSEGIRGQLTSRRVPRLKGVPCLRPIRSHSMSFWTRQFKPVYQPIIDLGSGEQIAVEALARWLDLAIAH